MDITTNIPHRQMLEDEGLKKTDLPDTLQRAIARFDERYNVYKSMKSRKEREGVEWKQKQATMDQLEELDDDITIKLTRFMEQRSNNGKEKELAMRAKALGLPPDASEEKIKEAEEAEKKKKDEAVKQQSEKRVQEGESKLPKNEQALKKLHDAGKTNVTIAELKTAGFDTTFWGPIGTNGCHVGKYRLYRDNQYQAKFNLSKS